MNLCDPHNITVPPITDDLQVIALHKILVSSHAEDPTHAFQLHSLHVYNQCTVVFLWNKCYIEHGQY